MRNASLIKTTLSVDPPLQQDADFQYDENDRQFIDNQIRGIQEHLVDAVIKGRHGTWYQLAGTSAAVSPGDTVCLAGTGTGTVTKAVAGALAGAKAALGVVIYAAAPGARVFVANGGVVSSAVTGLAATTAGDVRVNTTTSRLERVDALVDGDFGMGTSDIAGWLSVKPGATAAGSGVGGGGGATVAADIAKSAGAAIDRVRGFRGIPLVGTDGATPRVGGVWQYNAQGTAGYKVANPVVFHAQDYGCVGDGVADDTAALQALFNAAASPVGSTLLQSIGGRVVVFPNDAIYRCAGRITLDYKQFLTVRGPAKIHFTGTGSQPFISILSCFSLVFEDIHFTYLSELFTGDIIRTGHGVSGSDVSSLTFNRCSFYGTQDVIGFHHAKSCLSLKNCIDIRVHDCIFTAALRGIDGHHADFGFCNTVLIDGCIFFKIGDGIPTPTVYAVDGITVITPANGGTCASIWNPGEAWTIVNNTFEPLQGAGYTSVSKNAVLQELDYWSWALHFAGNWIGDGDASGPWLTLKTLGANIAGNLISGGLPTAMVIAGSNGVNIVGNRIAGSIEFQLDVNGAYSSGCFTGGNSIQSPVPYRGTQFCSRWVRLGNEDSVSTDTIPGILTIGEYGCTYNRVILSPARTFDPGTVPAGEYAVSDDILHTSCQVGNVLSCGVSPAPPDGVLVTATVSSASFVRVTVWNQSGVAWTPGTLTMKFHTWA